MFVFSLLLRLCSSFAVGYKMTEEFSLASAMKGYANTATRWDDWVPQDRLRKFTEDNRELAATLRRDAESASRKANPPKSATKKRGGSDRSSARGSEERQTPARGTKRGRENEIEKVGIIIKFLATIYTRFSC